ncbi:angiotensin-converting enzyme-like isoform 2-T2 [Cochliomyia hominivorax]
MALARGDSYYDYTKPVYLNETGAQYLLMEINDMYWKSATAYRKFADDVLSPEILMREKLRPYYRTMEKFDWRNFKNPLTRRQFQVILRGAKYPPLDYNFKKATNILKTMAKRRYVCEKNKSRKCQLAFIHHIKSIFTNSDNLEDIKWYWQQWRNKMPQDIKDAFHYYVEYYQNMSTPEMPASAIWYDEYEDPNFIEELEELMDTIRPFYRELHAHLRHVLKMRYGENIIPANGLIPHHLMEQATYQAWKKDSVLRNPFPQRKLPNLQIEIDEYGYTPYDLVNMSAMYFNVLGFENITEDFMHKHFIEMESGEGGPDCKSRIFTYGEVELNYCPKVYYKKLLQTHGDVTQIQYALLKNNLRVGLNQEACPGFGNAMGEAIILSVSTPQHVQECLGLLKDYDYDDILNLNRLYRLAVHTVLTIPTYFVHEKLWLDIIDKKVKPEHYNCHYWNLMEKYMGVQKPAETNPGAYDMPYKFYEGIIDQFSSTKKLFGEFLGYQIYRGVCLKTGEYQRGNAYKTLHNCDFDNSPHAGVLFKEMMKAGSAQPWREIIQHLTIQKLSKLSATPIMEYYEPLHTWIAEDNLDKNLHVGWMTADQCRPIKITNSTAEFIDKHF